MNNIKRILNISMIEPDEKIMRYFLMKCLHLTKAVVLLS